MEQMELYFFLDTAEKRTKFYKIMQTRAPLAGQSGTISYGAIWRRTV